MTSLSDTLTVGLVLVLLFGSIALYLYTRIQQAEQKISLLESILLDLKMSTEIKSYSELPAENVVQKMGGFTTNQNSMNYTPFNDKDEEETGYDDNVFPGAVVGSSSPTPSVSSKNDNENDNEVTEYKSVIADAVKSDTEDKETTSKVSANYEAMTLKELQTLAKTRGISNASSMKKSAIIEALKTSDRSSEPIQPGSIGVSTSSFLETSSIFLGAAESE
jgi:hypothetical protein